MKKVVTKNWLIIALIIGVFAYLNKDYYYDSYGKRFNNERIESDILTIPTDWITEYRGTRTKLWHPTNMDEITKGRFGKEVLVEDGKVYIERDRIINKELGKDEALEITYQFEEESKFIYKYSKYEDNIRVLNKSLTKEEFNEIIHAWQIDLN